MPWSLFAVLLAGAATFVPAVFALDRAAAAEPAPSATQAGAVKYYIVGPTGTSEREYLFRIAARTLGDGRRYLEIFELNKGRLQPDGRRMEDPLVLMPGWILVLPNDADGEGVLVGTPPIFGSAQTSPSTPASAPSTSSSSADSIAVRIGAFIVVTAVLGVALHLLRRGRRIELPTPVRAALETGSEPLPDETPRPGLADLSRAGLTKLATLSRAGLASVRDRLAPNDDDRPDGPDSPAVEVEDALSSPAARAPAARTPVASAAASGTAGSGTAGSGTAGSGTAGSSTAVSSTAGSSTPAASSAASKTTERPAPPAGRPAVPPRFVPPVDDPPTPSEPLTRSDPTTRPEPTPRSEPVSRADVVSRPEPVPLPEPVIPPDPVTTRIEVSLRSGPDLVAVRLIGARPDADATFLSRGAAGPRRSGGAVVRLGDVGPDALWVDLAVSPDVIRITGTRAGVLRQSAAIARQLTRSGVSTVVVGEVPGVTDLANRQVASIRELVDTSGSPALVVVFLDELPATDVPVLHELIGRRRPRVVPIAVGSGPRSRWSIDVSSGTESQP